MQTYHLFFLFAVAYPGVLANVGNIMGVKNSTGEFLLHHDPRSEMRRKVTSGEENWRIKNERDEADLKSRPNITATWGKTFLKRKAHSKQSRKNDNHSESQLQYSIPTILDKELRALPHLHDVEIDRVTFVTIRNSAEAGSLDSGYFTALIYLYGFANVPRDPTKAIEWLRETAMAGHPESQCALGLLLYHGVSGTIGIDRKSAMLWFHRAAKDSDHARGYWLIGRALYEGMTYDEVGIESLVSDDYQTPLPHSLPDFDEAAKLFEKAAEESIPEANHQIAIMFEYGLIADENDEQQSIESMMIREDAVQSIQRFPPNYKRAAEYYERAAKMNFIESAYHLGLMYAFGRGVPKNYPVATDYFRQGASRSHAPSMRYLAIFAFNGYDQPDSVSHPKLAMFWFRECIRASRGDVKRQCESELNEIEVAIESSNVFKETMMKNLTLQGEKSDLSNSF
jgi:TPR repeat protein